MHDVKLRVKCCVAEYIWWRTTAHIYITPLYSSRVRAPRGAIISSVYGAEYIYKTRRATLGDEDARFTARFTMPIILFLPRCTSLHLLARRADFQKLPRMRKSWFFFVASLSRLQYIFACVTHARVYNCTFNRESARKLYKYSLKGD